MPCSSGSSGTRRRSITWRTVRTTTPVEAKTMRSSTPLPWARITLSIRFPSDSRPATDGYPPLGRGNRSTCRWHTRPVSGLRGRLPGQACRAGRSRWSDCGSALAGWCSTCSPPGRPGGSRSCCCTGSTDRRLLDPGGGDAGRGRVPGAGPRSAGLLAGARPGAVRVYRMSELVAAQCMPRSHRQRSQFGSVPPSPHLSHV